MQYCPFHIGYTGWDDVYCSKWEPKESVESDTKRIVDNEEPFRFAEKDSSSKRILEAAITYTFDGMYWNLKPTSDRGSKWVPFKSHSLRRCRTLMLRIFHNLTPWELLFYGGWEDKDMTKEPSGMSHYLYLEIDESDYTLLMLLMQATHFIHKLCIPFDKIHGTRFEQFLIKDRVRKDEGDKVEI